MATQLRSSFVTLAAALKAQLVARGVLNAECIHITARDSVPHFLAPQDILLRSGGETPHPDVIVAAGRIDNRRTRRVLVIMRSRMQLDQADEDVTRLLHATNGHHALEDAVADALEIFLPEDTDTNVIAAQPVRLTALSEPRPDPYDKDWVVSQWTLEIEYERALNQNYQ